MYEISVNPKIQNRLRLEIHTILKKYDGEITYEAVQEMKYLDCVLKEVMRLHPPLFFLTKRVTQDYTLEQPMKEDSSSGPLQLKLKRNDGVLIPVDAIHHDDALFPDPLLFDPERFNDENKDSIGKFTYLPFGDGPRGCLGINFGIMQSKVALIALVGNFEMSLNLRTKVTCPVEVEPAFFMNLPKHPYFIDFKALSK